MTSFQPRKPPESFKNIWTNSTAEPLTATQSLLTTEAAAISYLLNPSEPIQVINLNVRNAVSLVIGSLRPMPERSPIFSFGNFLKDGRTSAFDPLAIKICLINGAIFVPWMSFPFQHKWFE